MKYIQLPTESRERLMASLKEMPAFLHDAFSALPGFLQSESGPKGTFSPVEQAWHLADLEAMGFSERIRRLRTESDPQLPDFAGDVIARQRNYKSRSLAEGIEAFRQARERNLSTLSALTHEEWKKQGEQEGFGPVSLCDLPSMMAEHDESHRKEIEVWLSEARPGDGA